MTGRRIANYLGIVLSFGVGSAAACAPTSADDHQAVATIGQATSARPLAHPPVTGAAGPFARAVVTLVRRSDEEGAPFDGSLVSGAVRLALAGSEEPADFFLVYPKAVMFVPIDGTRVNGVVVLYDSSQIGPGHGTEHHVLVYRVGRDRAERQPAIEARLDGAANAASVRARLAKGKR